MWLIAISLIDCVAHILEREDLVKWQLVYGFFQLDIKDLQDALTTCTSVHVTTGVPPLAFWLALDCEWLQPAILWQVPSQMLTSMHHAPVTVPHKTSNISYDLQEVSGPSVHRPEHFVPP